MFSRVAGAGLALVATALLAVAIATPVVLPPQLSLFAGHPTVSHRTREFQEAYIGLYRAELCNTGGDGSCRTGDTKPAYRNIAYGGIATTGFLAISTLMMAFAAIRNSERRRSAAIQVWIASALAAGTVGALFVVGPFPAASEASVPIGLGTAIYGGGIFAALVASLFAGRRAQPLKLRAPDRAPIVAARHRIAPQQNAAPANRGPARELPPRPFDAVPARPSPPRSFDAVPARPSPPRSFDAAVPRRSPPRAFDAPAPPFAGDREAEPFDEAIFDPAAARSQPVPVPAPRSSFNVDDLPTPPPALEDRAWTQMKASFGPRSKPPTLAPPIGEARAPMPGTPPTPMPGTPPAPMAGTPPTPPADVAASPPRVPPPLAPPEPMASSDADSSRESSESFFAAFAAAHLQPVQPVHPVQPVAPPPPAYAATAAPSAPTSTGFAAQPFPAASPFAPTSTGFPAPQPPSASSSSTFAPPQAPPFNAQAFAAPPPSAALQPAPQGTPQASAMPWASEAPAPSPPLARSASPTGAPPPARTPRETSPPAPPAPRPGRETLPPPAPAPPTRSARETAPPPARTPRETAPPPARTPRETSPPPPPPRPARETLSPAAAPPPPARVVRDTQAPPPPARAARDSQSPLIPHAALAGEGPSAAKAASARAAVPMPERPTRSNPPTKPPLPLPNRGAPPRPGKSTVPPTFVIPPIPAVRPMPQVPVIPSRLDTEPVAPGSEPSTGVDLPMDDVTSTNNASFGNASPADATAATPRVEPPAAGGFKLETADTSPSGQPVGTAGHPPDLNGKRTTAPASSVAKPKLPISTAPDSLPPPSESELGGGPTPACPQCESPMGWVEEHLRFYCKSCRMYF